MASAPPAVLTARSGWVFRLVETCNFIFDVPWRAISLPHGLVSI